MTDEKVLTKSSKTRIRNLRQYKTMTDDQFNELWERRTTGVELSSEFEKRIGRKIKEFSEDYDIDDLKANDKLVLRALAQAYIQLEDLENYGYKNRIKGINDEDILFMEKLSNIMSALRRDISKMQDDLKITRRIRKGDKEESVINYIETLKKKAKEFYDSKMSYIFCPKCNMLLGTIWTLYPLEKGNKIQLVCNRKLENGEFCNTKTIVGTKELYEKKGSNSENVPEFFR